MQPHLPPYLQYLPFLFILPFLYLRLRRMLKPQVLKLNRLWIRPAILIVAAGVLTLMPVPGAAALQPLDGLWLLSAALLGAAAGWQWGRTTVLHLHPENGTLMQTGSLAGLMVFVVLVLFKFGLRGAPGAIGWHVNVMLITDISIVFSAALFSARTVEIFLRARKIMAGTAA